MAPTDTTTDVGSEAARVEAWRARSLIDAGYPTEVALNLAADTGVDLHQACRILTDGCPLRVALQILAPLPEQLP